MGGSEDNGGTDERGTLIQFPRSDWIPPEGIEPLNTQDLQPLSTSEDGGGPRQDGAGRSASSVTIEPDDFWESGETQEFVGVAPTNATRTSRAALGVAIAGKFHRLSIRAPLAAAGVAAVLVAAVAVGVWTLVVGHSGRPPASVVAIRSETHVSQASSHAGASHRSTAQRVQSTGRALAHHKATHIRRVTSPIVAEVTYQPSHSDSSTPAQARPETVTYASSTPPTTANGGNAVATASTGPAVRSSVSAFGANSALGPMSSPDG